MTVETPVLAALLYLLAINLVCFSAFAWDKRQSRLGRRRVRERTLLGLAGLGGTAGALAGQRFLRHKTRKQPFRGRLFGIVGLQSAVLVAAVLLLLPAWR